MDVKRPCKQLGPVDADREVESAGGADGFGGGKFEINEISGRQSEKLVHEEPKHSDTIRITKGIQKEYC